MQPNYKPPFVKFVKKQILPLQLAIEDAVEAIMENPAIGEQKSGDLNGVYIYKFKQNKMEYLLAYRPPSEEDISENSENVAMLDIDFYQIGTHENFYNGLKKYIKSKGK